MNGWIKSKRERDKYTTEEFRIVYVDIPPTGDGTYLPLLEYGLCLVTSFQRDYGKESEKKWETPLLPRDQEVRYQS